MSVSATVFHVIDGAGAFLKANQTGIRLFVILECGFDLVFALGNLESSVYGCCRKMLRCCCAKM